MIKQKIQEQLIFSLKADEKDKVNVLRYILAQIKNKEIEKKADLNDEETLAVLRKIIKELKESIEAFKKGRREDLVDEYTKQLNIVSSYLPAEISDEELKKEITRVITENQELYQKNPKAIIGIAIKALKGKADPARIIRILQTNT